MKNFVKSGDMMTVAAPYNLQSGDGCLIGTLFGIAAFSVLATAEVEIKTTGVFVLPKTSAQAWTVGQALYWDDTAKVVTSSNSGTTLIGKAGKAAANPSPTGTVRLNGF